MNGVDHAIHLDEEESHRLSGLANEALNDALSHLDRFSSGHGSNGWTECGSDGDVRLFSQNVGASLPMFLGQLTADSQCSVADLTAVLLSDACRRFWDPSYLASHLLGTCGENNRCAVLCTEQKGSPVSGEAMWTHVCTARHVSREHGERITYAATSVPGDFRRKHQGTLAAWGDKKELITKMWAMDVLRTTDQVQFSFLLQSEASSFRLPNFMLKQVLASWLGVCVKSIWRMASSGMIPKGGVCLVRAHHENASETLVLGSRQLSVSGPVIIQVASENGRG